VNNTNRTTTSGAMPRAEVALWVAGTAALVLYALPPGMPGRLLAVTALLVLAPAACAAAAVAAARSVSGALAHPWAVLAAGAGAAAASRLHVHTAGAGAEGWHAVLDVTGFGLVAAALAMILHQRDEERTAEIALDIGMILVAATVVTLRWSPGVHAILADPGAFGAPEIVGTFGAPIATGCAFLFGSVLLLVRGASPAGRAAAGIAAGTIGFGISAAPLAAGAGSCCSTTHASGLAFALGWLAMTYAALRVRQLGAGAFQPVGEEAAGSRLRMVVAPAVAIVLGAVVFDAAWGRPLHNGTAAAVALLGMLLALRSSQLLTAARTVSAQRDELAQTRALIEVSQALAGTTRLDETLDLITRHATRMFRGRAASIELLSADGRSLEFYAVDGLPRDMLHLRFPVEGSFSGWVVTHGRARSTTDTHTDPYFPAHTLPRLDGAPVAAAPLRYRDRTLGALSCIGNWPFSASDLELLTVLADQAAVAIENARMFQQVHQMSVTDPLTGLSNRRQLDRDLAREFSAAQRGRPLIVVMFDLNGFKDYNDRHGHVAGDHALRLFARALGSEMRSMNLAARYGGDEFIVLLTDADRAGAETFIERVRAAFPGPDPTPELAPLSAAAGYAEYQPDMESPDDLVAAADRALYARKTAVTRRRQRVAAEAVPTETSGDVS
jgi:diguanylate cyclase (GGDEF)-like protein